MAGYKMISMVLLIVLVALVGVSPIFARPPVLPLAFDPPAACPGATVSISVNIPADIVGDGISIAAVSPSLDDGSLYVVSSKPLGLIANPVCSIPEFSSLVQGASFGNVQCTFRVSESATCGGHYTVTVTLSTDASVDDSALSVSGPFDVPSTCCPVGGCVQPVNTFALLSPWLLAIGLVGCIGVVIFAKKRRP